MGGREGGRGTVDGDNGTRLSPLVVVVVVVVIIAKAVGLPCVLPSDVLSFVLFYIFLCSLPAVASSRERATIIHCIPLVTLRYRFVLRKLTIHTCGLTL